MVPEELLKFLTKYNRYLILGHREPDGDCLSSQKALALYLARSGKSTGLFSPGTFTRTEIGHLADDFETEIKPEDIDEDNTGVVILDCSTLERIGHLANYIKDLPIAVIDHHSAGKAFGEVQWIRPDYPATTLLVQEIIEALSGSGVSEEEARILFFGFSTDTGFFRHLDSGSSYFIEKASGLVKSGASPRDAYNAMNDGKKLGTRKLLGRILDRTESLENGQILLSWECLKDRRELQTDDRDSDNLYQLLLSIRNCEAVGIIREEQEGRCTVGLRSKNHVDVGAIAAEFGGGGHQKASGFALDGSIEDVRNLLLKKLIQSL